MSTPSTIRRPAPGASRLVINLGAAHVAGAQVGWPEGRVMVGRYAREELDPDPAGEDDWAARAGRALARMVRARHWRGEATVVLPGHLTLVKRTRTPSIGEAGRAAALRFAAQQSLPEALEHLTWDGVVVSDDGAELELLFGTVRTSVVEAAVAAVTQSGLKVAHVRPPGLPPPGPWMDGEQRGLFVNIGARSTLLHFRWPGGWWVRRIGTAGNSVTRLLARGLDADFATAQRLKHDPGADRQDPGLAAVRRAAGREFAELLATEIRRTALAYGCCEGTDRAHQLWLAGGGSRLPGLAANLSALLERPVRLAGGVGDFAAIHGADSSDPGECSDLLTLSATDEAGSAGAVAGIGWPDLLPWRMKLARLATRRRRLALVAVAGLAFAPLAVAWGYDRRVEHLGAERSRLVAELEPYRRAGEEQEALVQRLGRLRTAWEAAVRLRAQAESWPAFLTGLDAAVTAVNGAWLERLVPLGGATPTGARAPGGPRRIAVAGRLRVAAADEQDETASRMRRLSEGFARLPEVAAVTAERFDRRAADELRFECVLNLRSNVFL
jgi:type IV pilus assembly protein PilM